MLDRAAIPCKVRPVPYIMSELRLKDRQFIQHYMGNGHNATKAYMAVAPRASATTAASEGSRILKRPEVQAYLAEQIEPQIEAKTVLTKQDLIDYTRHGLEGCKAENNYNSLFRGVDVAAKLTGSYSQEESDQAMYEVFLNKVRIDQVNINLPSTDQPSIGRVIDGHCETIEDVTTIKEHRT